LASGRAVQVAEEDEVEIEDGEDFCHIKEPNTKNKK